jgi:hypothetical protein
MDARTKLILLLLAISIVFVGALVALDYEALMDQQKQGVMGKK